MEEQKNVTVEQISRLIFTKYVDDPQVDTIWVRHIGNWDTLYKGNINTFQSLPEMSLVRGMNVKGIDVERGEDSYESTLILYVGEEDSDE